jgi:hypothetical protein
MLVLFLLAIVLAALALGDLQILRALFLNQKRVCNFTWLDTIQCEKKHATIQCEKKHAYNFQSGSI